nr:hypothetical protein [Tanacetum cinerariifolium]
MLFDLITYGVDDVICLLIVDVVSVLVNVVSVLVVKLLTLNELTQSTR